MKFQIFVDEVSPRLHYVCDYIFHHIVKVDYQIINGEEEITHPDFLINYSHRDLKCKCRITPSGFLHSSHEQKAYQPSFQLLHFPVLFFNPNCPYQFDVFSAIFFMLSRYEEYFTKDVDQHGRMKAEKTVAFKYGFLELPVVDIWVDDFLLKIGVSNQYQQQFQFVQTYDIDNAYAYRYKGFWRNLGGLLKSAFSLKLGDFIQRILVLGKFEKDPYDSYGYQFKIAEKSGIKPIWFLQIGTYSKYDTNIPVKSGGYLNLISYFKKAGSIGLHPSYASNSSFETLEEEHRRLSKIKGTKITHSRQHYLKLNFPETYQNLIKIGITDDYSMGYSSLTGFRAGTCRPFRWYDLSSEEATRLTIHSFFCMDGTLKEYMQLSTDEAMAKISYAIAIIQKYQGEFVSLWHNHSVSNKNEWAGWRVVFEKQYELLQQRNVESFEKS